mmetsp:Transcript_66901/g.120441  ORF Transcript_66901/g.120441 Transcript_66901/m.120441 type:complete len:95 (-) Transcript_66901:3-287(-)
MKEISTAAGAEETLALFQERCGEFDRFHLAAALRGVAAGQGPLLVAPYDARLLSLTEAVSAQVDAFGARDLANFSWAVATLRFNSELFLGVAFT